MNCYKCGSILDLSRNTCPKCGTDVRMYKKIVYASNRYYNNGLLKAQARDLTGARDALKMSLYLNKENINARNLLGLVYYAMGESAEGLKQWVLSKNLSDRNNIADRFINSMKRNMHDLDSEAHGIRKYNQALGYARNGARDLATIQLKKVVAVHTNMVKAYELLALIYMEDKKYDQARKVLTKCLEVDRGNTSAMYYMKELDQMSRQNTARSIGTVGDDEREQLIIPVRFRDFGTYLSNALYIVLGLAIGIAIAWFVVVPGKVQKETGDAVAQARAFEEQISGLEQSLAAKDLELQEAESRAEAATETAAPSSEAGSEEQEEQEEENTAIALRKVPMITGWSANQRAILNCVDLWNEGRLAEFISKFFTIDPSMISSSYQDHYRNLLIIISDEGVYNRVLSEASQAVQEEKTDEAAALYDAAALLKPEDEESCYQSALCHENAGDDEGAADRYYLMVNLFPDSEHAADAEERYLELTGEDSVPSLPRGVRRAELTKPVDAEEMLYQMTGERGPLIPEETEQPEDEEQPEGETEQPEDEAQPEGDEQHEEEQTAEG